MNKEDIENTKKSANALGYDYLVELIDKIYNAYNVEENEDIKELLKELFKYVSIF